MFWKKEGILLREARDHVSVTVRRSDSTQIFFDVNFEKKLRHLVPTSDCMLIIDSHVFAAHKKRFENYKYVVIDAGDQHKNQATIDMIIDAALEHKISRAGYFVGVGGGTVTDMVGFAANNYFRGIRYINVPTSLLGMVDAAVGGKTAINHPHQKNMIGSFYHPTALIYDYSFLVSLDARNLHNGFGEIIKVALLSNRPLFARLHDVTWPWTTPDAAMKEIIRTTVTEKLRMLGDNCFERDLKRPLNLGHSIAHPIEDITHFKIMHGEAVAIGCLFAAAISVQRGSMTTELYDQLEKLVESFSLRRYSDDIAIDRELLWERLQRLIMQRGGKGLLYVLPTSLGACDIVTSITREEFDTAYDRVIDARVCVGPVTHSALSHA